MARARAALGRAGHAELKDGTWRRYEKATKDLVAFHRATREGPDPTPPFRQSLLRDWGGDLIARRLASAATLVAGVSKVNVRAGGPALRDDPAIQAALTGWARQRPPAVKKHPFTAARVASAVECLDLDTLKGCRAAALLSVGRAGAWRGPSELLRAVLPLMPVPGHGAEVLVHTKSDWNKYDRTARAIPDAAVVGPSPLGLLQRYLRMSGHTSGLMFRSIVGTGAQARSTESAVSPTTLGELVKTAAAHQGLNPEKYATHSLRHGFADDVKHSGVREDVGMAAGGWRSASAYRGYGGAAARRLSQQRSGAAWRASASAPRTGGDPSCPAPARCTHRACTWQLFRCWLAPLATTAKESTNQ